MATFSRHQASLGNASSYQVSGYPYISGSIATTAGSAAAGVGSEFHFVFPRVTKSVTVYFQSGSAGTPDAGGGTAGLRVHFHSTGTMGDINGATGSITQNGTGLRNHTGIATGSSAHSDCTSTVLVHRHYVELNSLDESITFDVKCKEIFVSRADCAAENGGATDIEFRVIAELTNIPISEFGELVGCGLTEASGTLGVDPATTEE